MYRFVFLREYCLCMVIENAYVSEIRHILNMCPKYFWLMDDVA